MLAAIVSLVVDVRVLAGNEMEGRVRARRRALCIGRPGEAFYLAIEAGTGI